MLPKRPFDVPANDETLKRTAEALTRNGIAAKIVDSAQQAREEVLRLVPERAEVMTMSSMTLETTGLAKAINASGKFLPVRDRLLAMDRNTHGADMRRLGAAPAYAVGSVHAVTEDGQLLIASNSGSQLPAYAYAAGNVIWVVGAQKVVKDIAQGLERIHTYVFPLEDARAQKAYGMGSGVNKILIINKEIAPSRCTVILVREPLGF